MVSNQYSEKDPSVWALCFGRNHAKFPNLHQVADVSLSWENKMIYQQDNTYTGKMQTMEILPQEKKTLTKIYYSLRLPGSRQFAQHNVKYLKSLLRSIWLPPS
jgi:hypothetical protein